MHEKPRKTCLADHLLKHFLLPGTPLTELGAGDGEMSNYFREHGVRIRCYDSSAEIAALSKGLCERADLARPSAGVNTSDVALSIEVGEHIPPALAKHYLDNLAAAARKTLIVSWAHPQQGGLDHVNERPRQWVIDQLNQRGFRENKAAMSRFYSESVECYAQRRAFQANAGRYKDPGAHLYLLNLIVLCRNATCASTASSQKTSYEDAEAEAEAASAELYQKHLQKHAELYQKDPMARCWWGQCTRKDKRG